MSRGNALVCVLLLAAAPVYGQGVIPPKASVADFVGTLPSANGGTDVTSAADDTVLVGGGSAFQLQTLTTCTGTGKAVTYDASSNTFGCNTISGGSPGGSGSELQYRVDGSTLGGIPGSSVNGSAVMFDALSVSPADVHVRDEFMLGSDSAFFGQLNWVPDGPDPFEGIASEANHPGIYRYPNSGTDTDARGVHMADQDSHVMLVGLSGGVWRMAFVARVDRATGLKVFLGANNDYATESIAAGYYFTVTSGVGAGTWQAVTENADTPTTTDTGVALDLNFHTFEIRSTAASVTFWIDGVLKATHSTNRTNTGLIPVMFTVQNEASPSTINLDIDLFSFWQKAER